MKLVVRLTGASILGIAMRIFQVIIESTNYAVPGNQVWYRNLYEPLVEMGHDIVFLSARDGYQAMLRGSRRARMRFSERMLEVFKREHSKKGFDLFFGYLMEGMFEPDVILEIRRHGVPACNFSCNNTHQFYLVEDISSYFDLNLFAEKAAREKFERIGVPAMWWPMASNPRYARPVDVPKERQASFVGANYALRARYIGYLLQNGVDVHAYGPGWSAGDWRRPRSLVKPFLKPYYLALRELFSRTEQDRRRYAALREEYEFVRGLRRRFPGNFHLPIPDAEVVRLYSASSITLGFLEVFDLHDPTREILRHMHLRDFEGPMSGALYCTGFSDELADMFEPDREVITYSAKEELLDKVRFYLAHEREGDRIRRAGRARALRDHTYHKRFRDLFDAMGLG